MEFREVSIHNQWQSFRLNPRCYVSVSQMTPLVIMYLKVPFKWNFTVQIVINLVFSVKPIHINVSRVLFKGISEFWVCSFG